MKDEIEARKNALHCDEGEGTDGSTRRETACTTVVSITKTLASIQVFLDSECPHPSTYNVV